MKRPVITNRSFLCGDIQCLYITYKANIQFLHFNKKINENHS